jgi:prophage maintenance system killer protein
MARTRRNSVRTRRRSARPYEDLLGFGADDIVFVHDGAAGFGETWHRGVRDPGGLELIAERVRRHARMRSPPNSIASEVLRAVIQLHPFWDANHRTGYALAQEVLRFFGYRLEVPVEEAEAFVRSIDARNLGERAVLEWLQKWVRPLR